MVESMPSTSQSQVIKTAPRALVVGDVEVGIGETLADLLRRRGFVVLAAATTEAAVAICDVRAPSVFVVLAYQSAPLALDMLDAAYRRGGAPPALVLARTGTPERVRNHLMTARVLDLPCRASDLANALDAIVQARLPRGLAASS
jgi:hypothetical protein